MLKGAILGLGNIALGAHLPIYTQDPTIASQAKIVAAADLSAVNRERAAASYPDLKFYETAAALIENEKLDFIDICTPPVTHRPIIEQAARHGWHILCEKPLVTTREDLAAISRILSDKPLVFEPVHQYSFSPHWQKIYELRERENLAPYFFQARVLRTKANQGNAEWLPSWRTDQVESGGGILIDHGAHIFYLAISLLGQPLKITTVTRSFKHPYQVEDTAVILLEQEQGLTEITLSWAAQRRESEFLVLSAPAEILATEKSVTLFAENREERYPMPQEISGNSTHQHWYPPLFNNFFQKIRQRDYTPAKLQEALTATRCILAAYLSAERQRSVNLEEV